MSIALNPRGRADRIQPVRRLLPWTLLGVVAATLVAYITVDLRNPSRLHASPALDASSAAEEKSTDSSARGTSSVTLSEAKLEKAAIALARAGIVGLPTEVGVPGSIQANAEKQVDVRPRVAGIIREVRAWAGQRVKKGDILAVIDSREVGTARLDLRARQRELATARFEARWKAEIARNVRALIPELEKSIAEDLANRHRNAGKDPHDEEAEHEKGSPARSESIEIHFAGKDLGAYRGMLLQAFADYEIAVHEEEKNVELQRKGIVQGHPVVVARHTREGMQAKLSGTIEQVRYDAAQEQRLADQAMKQAEASVVDAAQRLRILGVTEDIPHLLEHPEEGNILAATEDVTCYQVVAPFDGYIIKRFAVESKPTDLTDVLFVLADLSSVWVKADVPESDFPRIARLQEELARHQDDPVRHPDVAIRFRATRAYPTEKFEARLLSIGSVVDPQTRTVPITARCENLAGKLKVGMFVNILLDDTTVEKVLTVPSSAVVDIESARYVFVPAGAESPRTFALRPVETGRREGDLTVIKAGLAEGEQVVTSGAFFLKSELILQNTEEE